MAQTNQSEAFSRVKIDDLLRDVGWTLTDAVSVRYEYTLEDGQRADYVLNDRHGRAIAVIEAKRASINPVEAEAQALGYARVLGVPFIFLSNGREIWFWEHDKEAHPRKVSTFFTQEELERRTSQRSIRADPMSIAVDNKVAGRDYQRDCINAVCTALNQGKRKMLVEMATGTGKTRTSAALIKRLFDANQINRVLFLVDRITLAHQTEDAFNEYLPDLPSYVLRAGKRFLDQKRITITTLQSMVNIYPDYSSGYFDLIISDECHRSIYGKWSGVLKHFDGIQVGLTATPCSVPDDVLDKLADKEDAAFVRDTLRFFELDKPTFSYNIKQAISDGYLVPYRIYTAKTVKTASADGFPVKRDELDWSAMDAETSAEFEALFNGQDSINVDPKALERKFTIPERNRAMVREFRSVIEKGYIGNDGVKRHAADGKTIVFAVTKKHAETLAHMFDQEFADQKPTPETRYADFVVSTPDNPETSDAQTKIKRFKREAYPKIMVSVNMLDTGFDAPEVVNLIMARYTESAILYQQMRGRGSRKADHIRKQYFTLFDFVGVTDFHKDSEDDIQGGMVTIRPKPQTDKPNARKLLQLDINDHIDPSTRGWITVDAEGNEVRPDAIEARALEFGQRFEGWFLSKSFTPEQTRLLRMIDEQIRANAASIEKFDKVSFYLPPFRDRYRIDIATQIFDSEGALDHTLNSLNEAVFGARYDTSDTMSGSSTQEKPLSH